MQIARFNLELSFETISIQIGLAAWTRSQIGFAFDAVIKIKLAFNSSQVLDSLKSPENRCSKRRWRIRTKVRLHRVRQSLLCLHDQTKRNRKEHVLGGGHVASSGEMFRGSLDGRYGRENSGRVAVEAKTWRFHLCHVHLLERARIRSSFVLCPSVRNYVFPACQHDCAYRTWANICEAKATTSFRRNDQFDD